MGYFFDINKIRNDFPILTPPTGGVYFDNACATLKPESVISAIENYYREYPACAGRSSHRLGEIVDQKVEGTRKRDRTKNRSF